MVLRRICSRCIKSLVVRQCVCWRSLDVRFKIISLYGDPYPGHKEDYRQTGRRTEYLYNFVWNNLALLNKAVAPPDSGSATVSIKLPYFEVLQSLR